jgi:hypothetical protein
MRLKQMRLNSIRISSALGLSGQSGVFSNQKFNSGHLILTLSGKTLSNPTRGSIQVSDTDHIEDKIGNFINHNCNPTCEIVNHNVVAIKDIDIDDEITFDYSRNENVLANPFICACCNKLIDGRLNN